MSLLQGSTDNETVSGYEAGLLILTYNNSLEERSISVCASDFDWRKTNLLCRFLGYETGKWGSYPRNFDYVSE